MPYKTRAKCPHRELAVIPNSHPNSLARDRLASVRLQLLLRIHCLGGAAKQRLALRLQLLKEHTLPRRSQSIPAGAEIPVTVASVRYILLNAGHGKVWS